MLTVLPVLHVQSEDDFDFIFEVYTGESFFENYAGVFIIDGSIFEIHTLWVRSFHILLAWMGATLIEIAFSHDNVLFVMNDLWNHFGSVRIQNESNASQMISSNFNQMTMYNF